MNTESNKAITCRLDDVCKVIQGGRQKFSGKDFVEDGYPAFGAGGHNGNLPTYEFDKPAIILSAIGARCGKCFFPTGKWSSLANTSLFFPDARKADARFLWYQLNDEHSWHRSGTAQPYIKPSDIKGREISLPPLAEQKRIAAILDAADALRAKRRDALAQLDALLQSTFLTLFGDPVSNPMRWEEDCLGNLFESIKNGANAVQREAGEGEWVVSRIETIWNGTVDSGRVKWTDPDPKLRANYKIGVGDILFSHINSPEHIAKTAIYLGEPEILIHGINLLRICVDRKKIDPIWMVHFLKMPTTRSHFRTRCKKAVNQASLNQSDIKSFPAYVPPLPLQRRFAGIVESIERLKALLRAHIAELDALFAALQHRAFRGEL